MRFVLLVVLIASGCATSEAEIRRRRDELRADLAQMALDREDADSEWTAGSLRDVYREARYEGRWRARQAFRRANRLFAGEVGRVDSIIKEQLVEMERHEIDVRLARAWFAEGKRLAYVRWLASLPCKERCTVIYRNCEGFAESYAAYEDGLKAYASVQNQVLMCANRAQLCQGECPKDG